MLATLCFACRGVPLPTVPAALQALQRKVGKFGVDLGLPEPEQEPEPQDIKNGNSKRLLDPAASAAAPAVAASAASTSTTEPSK